jgi:hypothetical protein
VRTHSAYATCVWGSVEGAAARGVLGAGGRRTVAGMAGLYGADAFAEVVVKGDGDVEAEVLLCPVAW